MNIPVWLGHSHACQKVRSYLIDIAGGFAVDTEECSERIAEYATFLEGMANQALCRVETRYMVPPKNETTMACQSLELPVARALNGLALQLKTIAKQIKGERFTEAVEGLQNGNVIKLLRSLDCREFSFS